MSSEMGWGTVDERIGDHERRLRSLEAWSASHGAECKAQWKQQADRNERTGGSIAKLHERVNDLPDKDDMHHITERMTAFTSDMEEKFRREEAERRRAVDKITEGQQRTIQAIERDRGRQEAAEKSGAKVSAWLIPLAVAVLSVVLTYLVSK